MTFTLIDSNENLTANSHEELVTKMRMGSRFDSDKSDADFMRDFASRQKLMDGKNIRADSSKNFVIDLLAEGLLR